MAFVSAQPIHTARTVPQTVAQIRAALPADQRTLFDAELAAATRFEVQGVVDEWWPRALLTGLPAVRDDVDQAVAALRRGEQVDLAPPDADHGSAQ